MSILQAFVKFNNEGAIIGRILAGYADLEIDLMNCVQVARGDLDTVLKAMFRTRGETARVLVADAMGRQHYASLGLEPPFETAITEMRYCLRIRNQYAHCNWYDDYSKMLAFVNLEEIATSNTPVKDLGSLTILHVDMSLLQEQLAYFEFVGALLVWLNFEAQFRQKKISASLGRAPAPPTRPALHIP